MMDRYGRVQLLLSQRRYDMAESELRQILAGEPRDATAMSLLSLCVLNDPKRLEEATETAQQAIGFAPDESLAHYALAASFLQRKRFGDAVQSMNEALRLDPYDADAFSVLARAELGRENYRGSLDAATKGLEIDPEHIDCGNLRSISLERLGRGEEAIASAGETLRRDPDDPMSHAAYGFTLLNSGRYQDAQVAFREALRLDPQNEMARVGMVNALNNRSPVFRLVHRYYVAMSRLNSKAAFALIFGAWLLMQVLSRLSAAVPALQPLIDPILICYVLFVVLTWIANPLFNTFLRFHPFGQHLLTRSERWASNLIAPCIALSLFSLIYGAVKIDWYVGVIAAAYWIVMAIPIAATFAMETVANRLLFGAATLFVALLVPVGVLRASAQDDFTPLTDSITWFVLSVFAVQIVSSIMASRTAQR